MYFAHRRTVAGDDDGTADAIDRCEGPALNIRKTLKALERARSSSTLEPFRLVVSEVGEPLDLAKATRTRTICPSGRLFEVVSLNGTDEGLSEEDLEEFIQSFPVDRLTR